MVNVICHDGMVCGVWQCVPVIFYFNKRINTVEIHMYAYMYRMDDLKTPGLLRVLFMYHNHMGGQEHCVKSYEV